MIGRVVVKSCICVSRGKRGMTEGRRLRARERGFVKKEVHCSYGKEREMQRTRKADAEYRRSYRRGRGRRGDKGKDEKEKDE